MSKLEEDTKNKPNERTFIVQLWSGIFYFLGWISVFQIIRLLFGKEKKKDEKPFVKTYLFVDLWVTANLVLSFSSIYIMKYTESAILSIIIVIYALLRIFEIFVYQVNVLLFDEYRAAAREEKKGKKEKKEQEEKNTKSYVLRSYRRIIILLLNNFAEIIFWFSSTYLYLSICFTPGLKEDTILEIIYKSFVRMTNCGSIIMEPNTSLAMAIIAFESIIGLFMTVIVLSRFIGLLPKPNTIEKSEQEKE